MEHCWTHRTAPQRRSKWLSLCRFDNGAEPDPQLAVADLDNASLLLFGEEGNLLKEILPPLPSWRPCAVAQGADNSLAVCDWRTNSLRLIFLDYRPSFLRSEKIGGASLTRPYGVTMTTAGNWVVADEDSVVLLSPFGSLLTRIHAGRGLPSGVTWAPRYVATDARQRVFVSDPFAGLVSIFDAAGQFVRHVSRGRLRHPAGLMVNDLEQLLVCDQGSACVSLFDDRGDFMYDVIRHDKTLPRISDEELAVESWRPVSVASTTPGQVCLTAAYGSNFVLQCFAYSFMPSSARSSQKKKAAVL